MTSEQQENSKLDSLMSGRMPIVILIVLILLSLVSIFVLGYYLLRSSDGETTTTPGEPTPFPSGGSSGTGGDGPIVVAISESETISVTLDVPVNLVLGNQTFDVQTQTINPDGTWSPGLPDDKTAGWVYGTVVNYIMGLSSSSDNQALLESLTPGSQITLLLTSGAKYLFEFQSRNLVASTDRTIFIQNIPGITLVLLEAGGDERLVVNGRFLVNETAASSGQSGSVEIGEPAQIQDLQIVVTGVTYMPNNPQTPPGYAFFLVDAQILNGGETAVDVNNLQLLLIDEIGNQYALNPVASQQGVNAPLTGGFLNAGQSQVVSIGYQIPAGLTSASLQWVVIDRSTGARIQVNIPFSGENSGQQAVITLQSVEISQDMANMNLSGQIINQGDQPLIISEDDVSLRTPDGASYLKLAANPPFPWTVPLGQTLLYTVTFQRPNADTAVFNVLNQPFQLSNLR